MIENKQRDLKERKKKKRKSKPADGAYSADQYAPASLLPDDLQTEPARPRSHVRHSRTSPGRERVEGRSPRAVRPSPPHSLPAVPQQVSQVSVSAPVTPVTAQLAATPVTVVVTPDIQDDAKEQTAPEIKREPEVTPEPEVEKPESPEVQLRKKGKKGKEKTKDKGKDKGKEKGKDKGKDKGKKGSKNRRSQGEEEATPESPIVATVNGGLEAEPRPQRPYSALPHYIGETISEEPPRSPGKSLSTTDIRAPVSGEDTPPQRPSSAVYPRMSKSQSLHGSLPGAGKAAGGGGGHPLAGAPGFLPAHRIYQMSREEIEFITRSQIFNIIKGKSVWVI